MANFASFRCIHCLRYVRTPLNVAYKREVTMPHVNKQSQRQSNSLVHRLKAKLFPEEIVPEVSQPIGKGSFASFNSDLGDSTSMSNDYIPPRNIDEILQSLYQEHIQLWDNTEPFSNSISKFRFLAYCGNTLGKRVGSNYIDEINSMEDLIEYYRMPAYKSSPLQRMNRSNTKPSNLVIFEDSLKDEEMTRRGHLWDRWIIE